MAASYKPSHLSYGSPRSSPFRRPESTSNPTSPSPLRQSTPNPSPAKMATTSTTTPSRLVRSSTVDSETESTATTATATWTPKGLTPANRDREASPTRGAASPGFGGMLTARNTGDNNALSKLQPAQVRELREGFQILDRDSDGQVGRDDVADMLTQLGLSVNASEITSFFPPSTSQTVTLPTFLNTLAIQLSALSHSAELLSAFSAFDEDDSGQVDLSELRDALLNTAPDPGEKALTEREVDRVMSGFTSRRAFGKHTHVSGLGKRGEVFKYQEFVASVAGGAGVDGKSEMGSED
ncbi:related to myosin regulatory light chain 1 [Rhynchosporium agropyri]|uniref:Related to myosin regulatory light chain 1 n=1 Tax=Rhynchosporium agropyri TaxID=914238 RepID=A0A1E1K0X1_9HELO|nr:related to myosin regulatory light chain 1 [Rhynchosporium agropyri]